MSRSSSVASSATTTDESFKRSPIEGQAIYHDNFLLGRDWFERAVQLVDNEGAERQVVGTTEDLKEYVDPQVQRKGRPGDLPFRSMPAHAQTRYAIGLEKESIKGVEATFGPRAMDQWRKALSTSGVEFASHVYDSPNQVDGRRPAGDAKDPPGGQRQDRRARPTTT